MKIVSVIVLVSLVVACSGIKDEKPLEPFNEIPTLDELSGQWVSYDTVEMEPSIRNFRGQALANRDLTSFSYLASAPFSGGYHTGTIRINGESPEVDKFRWQPYQIQRHAKQRNLEIMSTNRMVPDQNVILWKIELTNNGSEATDINITQDMIGFMGNYSDKEWQWWYPYPTLDGVTTSRTDNLEFMRKFIGTGTTSTETIAMEFTGAKPVSKKMVLTWPSDKEIMGGNGFST
ncbi:MAG: hypothetical protein DRI71_08085, partial [Bacteroidetes bacterium]